MNEERKLTEFPNPFIVLTQIITFPATLLTQLLANLFQGIQPPKITNSRAYENLEEWSVVRNEKGRIEKIVVHRSAQES